MTDTTKLRYKSVMRLDRANRIFRIGRFLWTVGKVGDGEGYSNKFSIALTPKLVSWHRGRWEWIVTVLGIRLHRQRAYGGHIV